MILGVRLWITRVSPGTPPVPYTSYGDPGHRVDFARPATHPRFQGRWPRPSVLRGTARRDVRRDCRPVVAITEYIKEYGHGRRHDAGAARERRPLRAPDSSLEPEDEALHLHRAQRHLHH